MKAISDAAFSGQTIVQPPERLSLKLLDISVPAPEGTWTAQANVNGWGQHDMLVRVLGNRELTLMPFMHPQIGSCSTLSPRNLGAAIVTNAPYVGASWSKTTFEVTLGTFVSALACHDLVSGRVLLAEVREEGAAILESDYKVISDLLENIGKAVDEKTRVDEPSAKN